MPSNSPLFEEKALNETRLFFDDRDAECRAELKKMTVSRDAASPGASDFVERIRPFIAIVQDLKQKQLDENKADSEPPINLIELSLFAFSYFGVKYIKSSEDSSQQSVLEALLSLHALCSKWIGEYTSENVEYRQILTQDNEFLARQASDRLLSNKNSPPQPIQLSQPHKIVQWAQLGMILSYIGLITVQGALDNPSVGLETATTVGSIAMPAIMLLLALGDYRYWSTAQDQNNSNLAEKKKAAKFTPLIPCLFLVANALKFAVDEHAVDAVLYSVLILIGVVKGLASKGTQDSEQNNSAIKKFGAGLLILAFAGGILNSAVTAWSQQTVISALQIPGGGFMDAMSQAGPIISGAFLVAVGVSIALKAYNTYQLHDKGIESGCSESGIHNI